MYQEWKGQTANSILTYSTTTWSDRACFLFEGVTTSYGEFARNIEQTRAALAGLGVGPGVHVATLIGLGPRWAEIFFATLSLGAVVVPLNLTWTARELAQGLALTDCHCLIVETHYRAQDLLALTCEAFPDLATAHRGRIALSQAPVLQSIIALRSEGFAGELPAYAEDLDARERGVNAPVAPVKVDPEDPALMLLTSGSTSFPKSAILSHRALVSGWATYADGLEVRETSIFVNCAPAYHVSGILTMGVTLLRGGLDAMMRWFDPERALTLIETLRATHFWGFDTHFAMMRDAPSYGQRDVRSVKHTLAASNPGAARAILDMGFEHHGCVYGSTEFMGQQSFFPRRDLHDRDRMLKTHGRATCGELRIVDPVSGAPLGPNQPGEICVRGPSLFSGYYKRPDETAKCMDDDGFFHSGDRGYLDEEGYLFYQGRFKEMIKSGGENVSILEVEQFLTAQVPGIRRVAVCATPHPKWSEAVTAIIVPEPGTTEADIVQACRGSLAPYKIPKRVVFVRDDQWSVTPTGKVDRKTMRKTALDALGIAE